MVTIENNSSSVTHVADTDSKEARSGLQGISAKIEDVLALYDRAISMYKAGNLKFSIDKNVSII